MSIIPWDEFGASLQTSPYDTSLEELCYTGKRFSAFYCGMCERPTGARWSAVCVMRKVEDEALGVGGAVGRAAAGGGRAVGGAGGCAGVCAGGVGGSGGAAGGDSDGDGNGDADYNDYTNSDSDTHEDAHGDEHTDQDAQPDGHAHARFGAVPSFIS